jgi:polysaccharide export outer membrane protein
MAVTQTTQPLDTPTNRQIEQVAPIAATAHGAGMTDTTKATVPTAAAPAALPSLPTLSVPVSAAAQVPSVKAPDLQNAGTAASTQPGSARTMPTSTAQQAVDLNVSQQPVTSSGSSMNGFAVRNPRYILRPGDTLEITFKFTPDFNESVSVQPDGFISLNYGDDMLAAGMDVPHLHAALVKRYSAVLRDPAITVTLKDYEKPYFTATGQVTRPGKYEMRGDTTVMEALAVAGGITEKAKHSQVLVFRRAPNDMVEVKQVNVKKLMAGAKAEDIHLLPGDMVFVPQTFISKLKPYLPTASMGTYVDPAKF